MNQNTESFCQEHVKFEDVFCQMFTPQCVNSLGAETRMFWYNLAFPVAPFTNMV